MSGCGCGGCACGGSGAESAGARAGRTPAPQAARPMAAAAGGAASPEGIVPGRKAGNILGLRAVSTAPATPGGCGCGHHGH